MNIYLTYNDAPSGIFKSQVIDRLQRIRQNGYAIQLVVFFAPVDFHQKKREVLNWDSSAIVLKQLPGLRYWWINLIKLTPVVLRLKPKIIIGRSVYATNLGLLLKKVNLVDKIVYDGRGAVTAECDEFKMVPFRWLLGIKSLESKSINQSDFQLAVSSALIKHWKSEFAYNKGTYAVLPCVYGESFEKVELTTDNISHARQTLGFSQEDTVITYSGSLAGWQFKTGLEIQLAEWLKMSSHHKLFFLSKNHQIIEDLKVLFPYQCEQRFVTPEEVPKYLIAADYGLLVREKLITNQVASPVKFAEYLSCGLQVIISSEVGDFSEFVQSRNCGFVWDGPLNFPFLEKLNFADKVKTRELAIRFFSDNSTSMMTQVQKSVNQVD